MVGSSYATGTPHLAYGTLRYSDDSIPSSISFNAYIKTRQAETLTTSSLNCGYDSSTGEWYVQCANFPTPWSIGDVLHVDFSDGGEGTGSVEIILTNNAFDNGGTTIITRPGRLITVATTPSGLQITVDSAPYTAPHIFNWEQGTTHTLSVASPQNGGAGVQYVYTSWSDGGAQDHDYTVPGSNQTVTANFKTQYYLTVNSSHGNPQGQGWYDANATANFSVASPDVAGSTRYIFQNWTGDYTGAGTSGSVTMDAPKNVTANWEIEYYLSVTSTYGTVTGSGWYRTGASAHFSVSPTVEPGETGIKYVFVKWTGAGYGFYTGSESSWSVTMNGPITETAQWKTEYYLSTSENPDKGGDMMPTPPGGWYDSKARVAVEAIPNTLGDYIFSGWSGDITGTTNPDTIILYAPKSVTANFSKKTEIEHKENRKSPPEEFLLMQNYPNPFNAQTIFSYQIPEDCNVYITIYSLLGNKVKELVNKRQRAGYYTLGWNGADNQGNAIPSGIYLLRMQANQFTKIIKITFVR